MLPYTHNMSRLDETYKIRKAKMDLAKKQGLELYPSRVKRTSSIKKVLQYFARNEKDKTSLVITGRLKTIRLHGGSCFSNIQDDSGAIQLFFKKDLLGTASYQQLKEFVDIGDFLQCQGTCFATKKGEKTILVNAYSIISKSLLPLPEKWHGLSDIETRYRQRYLDLISNPDIKITFQKRAQIINTLRNVLETNGFLEVETPILQPIPGGANAMPFVTHHHALHTDLYLRIAPELYLKRLIIGGFEKVYEIARCFRNEGIDKDHNPEFTQVEFYAAYWDYHMMMGFTEKLTLEIVKSIQKSAVIPHQGVDIDFSPPYQIYTFTEACRKYAKIDIKNKNEAELRKQATDRGLAIDKSFHKAKILDEIFKELVRDNLIQPTFITDHPIELSPLAKQKTDNPNYVERFQLIVGGIELANAFSELNDPIEQERRFLHQDSIRQSGDEEAQRIDKEFIEALSYGMPPTAGIGIGIDRLTAIITNQHNLKEVILFPTLKPKSK